jgi:hypothetical protein
MSSALTDFLAGLAARGHEPLLAKTTGRVCFELLDIPGRWGHIDAFGRGRVHVEAAGRLRPQLAAKDSPL